MENNFNIPENIPVKAKEELEILFKGNQNFVNGTPTTKNMSIETLQKFAFYQKPYAVILTCSDSRVVPEIIFDCGIGEIFVIRVAGVTTGPNIIESVEYAVHCLELPLLILLGHDDCGVMKFANDNYPVEPENFKSLMHCVYPVFEGKTEKTDSNTIAQRHTHLVENTLLKKSSIIKSAVENKKLYIANCHFDHSTGLVKLID